MCPHVIVHGWEMGWRDVRMFLMSTVEQVPGAGVYSNVDLAKVVGQLGPSCLVHSETGGLYPGKNGKF